MTSSRCPWCGEAKSATAVACAAHVDLERDRLREQRRGTADDAVEELEALERELRRQADEQ